jgi:hypothetical protein
LIGLRILQLQAGGVERSCATRLGRSDQVVVKLLNFPLTFPIS